MCYCAPSLEVYCSILPIFLVTCAIWCFLEYSFLNFLLRKYYNYLNNLDMVLLRTSYMYGTISNRYIERKPFKVIFMITYSLP